MPAKEDDSLKVEKPIVKFGRNSAGVILPKDWMKQNKLSFGDSVVMSLKASVIVILVKPERREAVLAEELKKSEKNVRPNV